MSKHCFICNTVVNSKRNCVNIFDRNIYPLEKKASEIIANILDITFDEKDAHSDTLCRNCHKVIVEFAELESRAGEIRTDLLSSYNSTIEALEKSEDDTMECNEEDGTKEGKEEEIAMDAEKLNKIVSESGGDLEELVAVNDDGSAERPRLLVVKDGTYEEIPWEQVMGDNDEPEDDNTGSSDAGIDVAETVESDDTHLKCKLCPTEEDGTQFKVEFVNTNLMSVHLKHEHNVRLYLCDVCGAAFKKRTALQAHIDEHVQEKDADLTCEVCHRVFNNLRLFRIHKRVHSGQNKSWTCPLCSKKYSSRNLLEEHMNTHFGVRPFKCTKCPKTFTSKYTQKAHLKTHEKRDRTFQCDICEKSYMTYQNLVQHLKTHIDTKEYICNQCGKAFGSMRSLEVHSVIHTGVKPFVCRTCGKAFARKAEIKDHERTHTGERPFQCDLCGAFFSQRSNLQSHRRVTHFNDRRYQCGDCGKGFKRRRLLDYHMKAVHTGERPYTCPTCDATFVYPEHYKKHMRIHTGVKPYKCEVCEKAFNSRDNRNAHRFVHSDKKPFECLVCGLGFMRKPLLYNHMQLAGHVNDTIVVNQPRLDKDDATGVSQDEDYELTIIDEEGSVHNIVQKKHVDYKALLSGNVKEITTDGMTRQVVGEDGHLVDLDGNIISIEQLEDESTMMAHINERGQLVNEEGQILSENAQALLGDETVEDEVYVKSDNEVKFVKVEAPDEENTRAW